MTKNIQSHGPGPVFLAVLDGWGIAAPKKGNAVASAHTPFFDACARQYRRFLLEASGQKVGLPAGVFGNSEVGHLNLGAGRVVYQDILRIDRAVEDGSFYHNQAFLEAIGHVKKNRGALHIMGLLSDGRVHSSIDHLFALLKMAKQEKVREVLIHAFLDGRDTPYNSGVRYIKRLEKKMAGLGLGRIASVIGRFYAMDRDNHWERTRKAYCLITENIGESHENAGRAVKEKYSQGIYDEEMTPLAIGERRVMGSQDAVIFFNYRADRARQLSKAFVAGRTPKDLGRKKRLGLVFSSMTRYEKGLSLAVAFPPENVRDGLGEIISKHGLKQMRLAETEKYAHVTYFFNGGIEKPFRGEDRRVIPSPRVESYAQAPKMSAEGIAKAAVEAIKSEKYSFILANFANADMVGHTGNIGAAKLGIETVDSCLKRIYAELEPLGGALLITADHGNADDMYNEKEKKMVKEHSYSPVPFIIVRPDFSKVNRVLFYREKKVGSLANVAPTILRLMGLPQPKAMGGKSLI